jgi:hypothetical protein
MTYIEKSAEHIYTYMYTHTYIYTHTHIQTHIYIYTHTHTYIYIQFENFDSLFLCNWHTDFKKNIINTAKGLA